MNKINSRITFVVLTALLVGGFPNFMIQEADAAVNGVTISEPLAGTSFGASFSIDYTVTEGTGNTASAGSITFTRTGGTADASSHVYTMTIPGDTSTGAHTITRTTLEADGGFATLVDGSEYTIDISITDGGSFTDQELVVTADFTTPTFTAAKTASNQITLTWSENIISTANAATANNPFVLAGTSLTVSSTSDISSETSTQVLTLSGDISDGAAITISYDTDVSNGDLLDRATTDPNAVPDINNVSVTGIPGVLVPRNNGSGCDDCEAPTLGINSKSKRIIENGFTYNGNSVDAERFFTPYPLITANVGKQNTAVFKIYEDKGPENIKHFSFAFGLDKGEYIGESKAMIELDIDHEGTETVTVTDPENTLDNIKVSTNITNCNEDDSDTQCLIVTIEHRFRAPLDFNIVGTDVWDMKRNAWQNYFNHGIQVTGESLNPPKEHDGIYQGQFYHLTETSKTSAVDEKGDSWSFQYGVWNKDFIPNKKSSDKITMHGYDRGTYGFDMYKYGQHLLAEITLNEICPNCNDTSFDKINNIFAYDYPIVQNSLDDPNIKSKIIFESEKAQKIINAIVNPYQE